MIQLGPDESYPLQSEIFLMHKLQNVKVTLFHFTMAVCGMATKTKQKNRKQQKRQNKKACKIGLCWEARIRNVRVQKSFTGKTFPQ